MISFCHAHPYHYPSIEALGYAVSVHRMQEYVELYAVLLKNPESGVFIARNSAGDGPEEKYHAVCKLAGMVRIDLEDG